MQSLGHACIFWARVVLGWVTSWEVLVLHPSFFVFFEFDLDFWMGKGGEFCGRNGVGVALFMLSVHFLYFSRIIKNLMVENCDIRAFNREKWSYGHNMCVFFLGYLSGAIIPALMHRIPSELRS